MTFAEKCRKLRKEKNLTQEETAHAAGISRRTYIYYETGQKLPRTRATVQKLADFFGVESNYLMVDNDDILEGKNSLSFSERAEVMLNELAKMLNDENIALEERKSLCRSLSEMCFEWNENNENLT